MELLAATAALTADWEDEAILGYEQKEEEKNLGLIYKFSQKDSNRP